MRNDLNLESGRLPRRKSPTLRPARRALAILALVLPLGLAWGRAWSRPELDSMERLPANIQNYIKLQDPQLREMVQPVGESSGLTMVGKWGRGDGWEVSGKDSLVFYSLGSECAIVNFAKPDSPQVLAVEFRGHNERLLTTG